MNETTQSKCKKHKILIIGDSHVIGLSEEIIDRLDDSYNVLGIAQPNADIAAITSQTYLQVEDLTKEDIIIFLGGTKDISRNESKKGLHVLEDFIQQTTNTNVILLGALHRYDLSSKSCVNTEVKLFNERLQSLADNSTHATILSVPTERHHHTRHGLHCNKKGKTWIVDVIVKRIKNWNSPCQMSAHIEQPRKEDVTNPGSQVASLISHATEEKDHQISPLITNATEDMDHQIQPQLQISGQSSEPPNSVTQNSEIVQNSNYANDTEINNKSDILLNTVSDSVNNTELNNKCDIVCMNMDNGDHHEKGAVMIAPTAPLTVPTRTSKRLKKTPYSMNADFLWSTAPLNRVCHQPV
jgi:hypothetical protein